MFSLFLSVEEDWNVVMRECSSLSAHWENLSGFLGLSISLIDRIKVSSHINVNACWNEALKNWIKQNYKTSRFGLPSWRTLLEAIARVNKLLFKRLADSHKGTRRTFLFSLISYLNNQSWLLVTGEMTMYVNCYGHFSCNYNIL